MREDLLKGLSEEQIEKVLNCKSVDEILAVAKAEGVELTDEQLEAISGGGCDAKQYFVCKFCGKTAAVPLPVIPKKKIYYMCYDCRKTWEEDMFQA